MIFHRLCLKQQIRSKYYSREAANGLTSVWPISSNQVLDPTVAPILVDEPETSEILGDPPERQSPPWSRGSALFGPNNVNLY